MDFFSALVRGPLFRNRKDVSAALRSAKLPRRGSCIEGLEPRRHLTLVYSYYDPQLNQNGDWDPDDYPSSYYADTTLTLDIPSITETHNFAYLAMSFAHYNSAGSGNDTFTLTVGSKSKVITIPDSTVDPYVMWIELVVPHTQSSLTATVAATGLESGDWIEFSDAQVSVHDTNIAAASTDLWWFGGEDAINYNEWTTLSIIDPPPPWNQAEWEVTGNTSAVELDNGGVNKGDLVIAEQPDTTVILNTAGGSSTVDDVEISLKIDGVQVDTLNLTVKQPASIEVIGFEDSWTGQNYKTAYEMKILDQFATVLPRNVEINETLGQPVEDWGGHTWDFHPPNGGMVNPASFKDNYTGDQDGNPAPVAPNDANAGDEIFHLYQVYYVGSVTSGLGIAVKGHTVQIYRGYARQE